MQNSVQTTHCATCGKPVSDGSKFCTFCGAAMEQISAAGQIVTSGPVEMNWERLAVRGLGPGAIRAQSAGSGRLARVGHGKGVVGWVQLHPFGRPTRATDAIEGRVPDHCSGGILGSHVST